MTAPTAAANRRVYAILLTDDSKVLLLRRVHRGFAPYWIAPGGTILPGEQPDAALTRILDDALGATAIILQRAFELDLGDLGHHVYYICRLQTFNYAARDAQADGAALAAVTTPDYLALVCDSLRQRDLYPTELSAYLLARCP